MENKLKEIIASVLELDEIDEDCSAATMDEWDSLKQMNIIVSLEEEFNVKFTEEETIYLNGYRLLKEALINKIQ